MSEKKAAAARARANSPLFFPATASGKLPRVFYDRREKESKPAFNGRQKAGALSAKNEREKRTEKNLFFRDGKDAKPAGSGNIFPLRRKRFRSAEKGGGSIQTLGKGVGQEVNSRGRGAVSEELRTIHSAGSVLNSFDR